MIAEIIIIHESGIVEPFPVFTAVMQVLYCIIMAALLIAIVCGKE